MIEPRDSIVGLMSRNGPRVDRMSVENVEKLVHNVGEVISNSSAPFGSGRMSMSQDSIPCVIITNNVMIGAFQSYADFKTKSYGVIFR